MAARILPAVGAILRGSEAIPLSAASADDLDAVAAAIPKPANTAPPMIADDAAKGDAPRYALENHTHQGNVQAERRSFTLVSGRATWSFPQPFAAGVVPIVNVTAETPDVTTYYYDARVVKDTVSNTGCIIMVNKVNQSQTLGAALANLLGAVISIFVPATGSVTIHCWARKP